MMQPQGNRQYLQVNYDYDNPIDQRRANGLLNLLILGMVIWFIWLIFLGLPRILLEGTITPLILGILLTPIMSGIIYITLQRGYLLIASVLFISGIFPPSLINLADAGVNSGSLVIMAVPIVAGGLLLRARGYGIVITIVIFFVFSLAIADYETFEQARDDGLFGPVLSLGIIIAFFSFWVGYMDRIISQSRDDLIRYSHIGDFSGAISREDEDSAIRDLLIYLRATLGYSFAQFFEVDENGQINRRLRARIGAATGVETSEIVVSDVSVLTNAANMQQPIHVSTASLPSRRDHLLPSSAFGLVVPLLVNDEVRGVVDLQDNSQPFTDADEQLLVSLVTQLGLIIADLQRMNALRGQLKEAETTIMNMRRTMRDNPQVAQQGITTEWETYLQQRGQAAIGYDMRGENKQLVLMSDLPEHMHAALNAGQVVTQATDAAQELIVPIRLRGDVIGAMAFELPLDHEMNERRLEMAQDVADQLALALDNKRLFEQSRNQASRERKANEIGNRLLSATDLDTLLTVAADSFNEALGAVQTYIHVQPNEATTLDVANGSAIREDGDNA